MDRVRILASAIANRPEGVKNGHDLLIIRSLAADLQESVAEVQSLSQSARSQNGSSNRNGDHHARQANDLPRRNIFDRLATGERTYHRLSGNRRSHSPTGRDNSPNV